MPTATISNRPWSAFSPADYKDAAAYAAACLIDQSKPGMDKTLETAKLPVYEPSGALNRNAVHAAANALAGGRSPLQATPAEKRSAAKKLSGLYALLKEDLPPSIQSML